MPIDFGTHHRLSTSGLVHASNTMRAGLLKVRVTTSSRSDLRSTEVRFLMGPDSPSRFAFIELPFPFPFQFLDNPLQHVHACLQELAIPLDPSHHFHHHA